MPSIMANHGNVPMFLARLILAVAVSLALCVPMMAVESQITTYQPAPFFDNPGVVDGTVTTVPIVDGQPNQAPYGYVVYLPPGYTADNSTSWPIVFCLQGTGEFGTGRDSTHLYGRMTTSGPLLRIKQDLWDFPAICVSPQAFSFGMPAASYPFGATGGWGGTNYLKWFVDFMKQKYRVDTYRMYMTGLCEGGQGSIAYAGAYPNELAAVMPIEIINGPGGYPVPSDAARATIVAPMVNTPMWFVQNWGDYSYPKTSPLMWVDDIVSVAKGSTVRAMTNYPVMFGYSGPGYDLIAADLDPVTNLPAYGRTVGNYSNCTITPNSTVITGSFPGNAGTTWTGNADGSKPSTFAIIGSNTSTPMTVPIYFANAGQINLAQPYTGTLTGKYTVTVKAPIGYHATGHYGASGWVWKRGETMPTERPAVERLITLYAFYDHASGWRQIWNNPSAWNWMFRQAKPGAVMRNDPPTVSVSSPVLSAGLTADYYGGLSVSNLPNFSLLTPSLTRAEANINQPTGWTGLPWSSNFGASYRGKIFLPAAGAWTFSTNSDDGSKLLVDGQTLVLNDGSHGMETRSGTATLTAGEHDFQVDYFQGGGGLGLIAYWAGPGVAQQIIPATAFDRSWMPTSINEGDGLTLVVTGMDINFDQMTFDWDINGDGVFTDVTGPNLALNWSQLRAFGRSSGTFPVVARANDGRGGLGTKSVMVQIVNRPPTVAINGPFTVNQGQGITLHATGSDLAGPVTFAWDLNNDGQAIEAAGSDPVVSWSTLYANGISSGSKAITVVGSDAQGGSVASIGSITVVNVPPIVGAGGPYQVTQGSNLVLSASATDPGGDAVTLAWDIDGNGAFTDAVGFSPTIPWTQMAGFGTGSRTIAVKATDALGGSSTASTTVLFVSAPPTIAVGGPYVFQEGASQIFNATAVDFLGAAVSVAWDLDGNGVFNDGPGATTVTWASARSLGLGAGVYAISARATDDEGNSTTSNTTLTVQDVPTVVLAGGPYAINEGSSLTFGASASDPGQDTFIYAWDINNDGVFTDASGASPTLTWTQFKTLGVANGTATIAVRVNAVVSTATVSVANLPPQVTAGPFQGDLGYPLTLAATASDPGDDAITYAWDLNADGIFGDLTGADPVLSPAQLATLGTGPHAISVRVTDTEGATATAATTLEVMAPPTIVNGGPYVSTEGGGHAFSATAVDYLGVPVLVAWDLNGDGNYDDGAGSTTLTWTTARALGLTAGVHPVSAKATDIRGAIATSSTTLTVADVPTIVSAGGPYAINEGSALTLAATANDPGQDVFSFVWDLNNDGSFTDATGSAPTIVWSQLTTLGVVNGTASLAVHVNGVVGITNVVVTNLIPQVSAGGPYSVAAGSSVTLAATASDPGGDAITYTWDVNGDGVFGELTGSTPVVTTAQIAALGSGPHPISVRATDTEGALATATTTLDVTAPPTITTSGPYVFAEGVALVFNASSIDYLGNLVAVAWDLDGNGIYNDGAGAHTKTWADARALGLTVGIRTISAKATDERGLTSTSSTTLTITDVPTTVSAGGPYVVNEGSVLVLGGTASDPGQDTFTYAWDINGDGIFTDATGAAPTVAWSQLLGFGIINGSRTVAVTVNGVVATSTVNIVNLPPVVSAGGPYTSSMTTSVTVSAIGSDPGGDTLTYAWDINADGVYGDLNGAAPVITSNQLLALGSGLRTIAVRATDADGGAATASTTLDIIALQADTLAWRDAVTAAGGTLTAAELSAHDQWRSDVGDVIASKFRTAHLYWVGNSIAKRVPYFRRWGSSMLTVEGNPGESARGYSFNGTAGQRVRTGIVPSTQAEFSQFDQFFLVWTYGRRSTGPKVDQALFGARSGSTAQFRVGVNWVAAHNSLEVYAGNGFQTTNNYTQTEGPYSGSIGLRALAGTAVSYRNGLARTTTTLYTTDDKPSNEIWVGGINGMGPVYYNGDVGCWFAGKGLSNTEYTTLALATQKLADTLSVANTLVARGDSIVAAGIGLDVVAGVTDPNLWFQYSSTNLAVTGATIAQTRAALNAELAGAALQRDRLAVVSVGRNDVRINADVAAMTTGILGVLNAPNDRGHYRWIELMPMKMGNHDEDIGLPLYNRRLALNNAVEAAIGQRVVRVVEAMRGCATITNATDIADLDLGLTPTSMRNDSLHPNTAGKAVMSRALWETLRNGLGTPGNPPTNYIAPLTWISATVGSTANVGQVLKATPGGWAGNPAWTYQWQRGGVDIPGATTSSYASDMGDNGATLRVRITGTNGFGTATTVSNGIQVTIPAGPG